MKYLMDTHIFIWFALSANKIPKNIREILESPDTELFVSTLSFLEIAIKQTIGKLSLEDLDIDDLIQLCADEKVEIVQLPIEAIKAYNNLPLKENHKDPFDRALISLCIAKNYTFLSVDEKFKQYQEEGLRLLS